MIYWHIQLKDGRTGWQVMNDQFADAVTVDEDNKPLTGNIEYAVIETDTRPTWAV